MQDHLGNDYASQKLLERKKRVDAQIDECARVFALPAISENAKHTISETFIILMEMQKDLAMKINFISAVCLN